MSTIQRPRNRQGFEIAIICALPLEANAVIAIFDHHWDRQDQIYSKAKGDPNAYTTGVIGKHNVVVAHMPGMGKVSAAGVAVGLRISFPNIQLALVVGICGGVPHSPHHQSDIHLGDVIISQCVVQYDFGKQYPGVFQPTDTETSSGSTPAVIQCILRRLQTDHHATQLREDTVAFLKEVQQKSPRSTHPGAEFDQLYNPAYVHHHGDPVDCDVCWRDEKHVCSTALRMTCPQLGCEADKLVYRRRSPNFAESDVLQQSSPSIHIGKMGSGDTVMRSGIHRDEIATRDGIIAFEMEGSGVSAYFPTLVIKGVGDYADSHKSKQWQDYAAATAAACTKAFLKHWTCGHGLNEGPPEPIFMVGITRDDSLIGREDIMASIGKMLSTSGHNRVALVALGGIGKTRVALEYALTFRKSSTSVFWIHASTRARILDTYSRMARKVGLVGYRDGESDGPLLLKEWFESDAAGQWLIVLDNADNHALFYGPERMIDILPRSENGAILMTTRDKTIGFDFAGATRLLRLPPLDSDQAQYLLVSRLGDETDMESCKALCEELQGIPLAIVQASAFMHRNSIDAADYLALYRESSSAQIRLLSEDFEDCVRDKDSKNAIAATWCISFRYIEEIVPLAGELLKRMSILDSQAIPFALIKSREPEHDLVKALGTLQAFCLISPRITAKRKASITDKTYDLHRLVRLAVRNWLRQRDLLVLQTAKTLKIVSTNHPDVENTGFMEIDRLRTYLPHAVAVLSSSELRTCGQDSTVPTAFQGQEGTKTHAEDSMPCAACAADLMMNVSFTSEYSGDWEGCMKWALDAIPLRTFVFGGAHQLTVRALMRAATGCYHSGRIEASVMLAGKAIHIIDTTDTTPSCVASKFEILGFKMIEDGLAPLVEIEECFCKALAIRTEIFGPDHYHVVRTKFHLSQFYAEQDQYAEEEQLLQEIIGSLTRISGADSAGTLLVMSAVALNYALTGRENEALALSCELSLWEASVCETRHVERLVVLTNQSLSHFALGRYNQAADVGQRALKLSCELNSVSTLAVMRHLAVCYDRQGYQAEAEGIRLKAMDWIAKRVREERSVATEVIDEIGHLASFYNQQARYHEARLLKDKVVKLETAKLGRQSPEVILSMCELGLIYAYQGSHEQAAKYRYSVLKYPLASPQARIPRHICRMMSIALDLWKHSHYIEAERIAEDAVMLARLNKGGVQSQIAQTLAGVCSDLHALSKATKLTQEASQILNSSAIDRDIPSSLACYTSVILRGSAQQQFKSTVSGQYDKIPTVQTRVLETEPIQNHEPLPSRPIRTEGTRLPLKLKNTSHTLRRWKHFMNVWSSAQASSPTSGV
ncbi:hypothetical protein BJX99DRAFT_256418 [Aspergillus californicus]